MPLRVSILPIPVHMGRFFPTTSPSTSIVRGSSRERDRRQGPFPYYSSSRLAGNIQHLLLATYRPTGQELDLGLSLADVGHIIDINLDEAHPYGYLPQQFWPLNFVYGIRPSQAEAMAACRFFARGKRVATTVAYPSSARPRFVMS